MSNPGTFLVPKNVLNFCTENIKRILLGDAEMGIEIWKIFLNCMYKFTKRGRHQPPGVSSEMTNAEYSHNFTEGRSTLSKKK